MQQHKIVEEYLDGIIPQKISPKTEEEIREEIKSHIYDKADFYIEIGYDEETAIKKAVEQMGEAEDVKAKFSALYKDSLCKAILLFFGICTWDVAAVTAYLGYMNFVDPVDYELPSVAFLIPVLAAIVFLVVYTVKCIRQKLQKQLLGIIWAFVLISLRSFVISGIFFPVINAGKLIIKYITNGAYPTEGPVAGSDMDIIIANILLVILYTALSFRAYNKMGFRNKPYRLSLKQITVILSAVSVCFTVVYGFAYAKYEWNYTQVLNEAKGNDVSISAMTAEQRKMYDCIEVGDKIEETEKILTQNGFAKQKNNYSDYIADCYMPFWVDDYLSEKNLQETDKSKHSVYCNTIESEYSNITSCIVVSYNANGEIGYKLFIPDVEQIGQICYLNYGHGEEMADLSENTEKGDSVENILGFVRTTGAHIIEDEKHVGEKTVNTYKIYFSCYYPLEPDFFDLIINSFDEEKYEYDLEIVAENGAIKEFEVIDKVGAE